MKRRPPDPDVFRGRKVQVGDVAQGLMSVVDLVDAGHRVIFDDEAHGGCYVEHKKTGIRMWFRRTGKVYKLAFEIALYGGSSFTRPAARS